MFCPFVESHVARQFGTYPHLKIGSLGCYYYMYLICLVVHHILKECFPPYT